MHEFLIESDLKKISTKNTEATDQHQKLNQSDEEFYLS